MKSDFTYYDLFYKFIETYAPVGYQGIDGNDPLIVDLEKLMDQQNQFFFVGDIIESRIIWTSNRSHEMIGVKSENLTAYHFMEATHPEDYNKHSLEKAKMYSLGNDFFAAEKRIALLSINIRIRNLYGEYSDLLFQLYFLLKMGANVGIKQELYFRHLDRNKKVNAIEFAREDKIIQTIELIKKYEKLEK